MGLDETGPGTQVSPSAVQQDDKDTREASA
jgi:hypothetical protein